nr:uncharacterized skeletal organic matrix protein 2-like isoform X1 [Pocillopora verrucosa]
MIHNLRGALLNTIYTMKSVFLIASLLLINASVLSVAVNKCFNCVESNWNKCEKSQTRTQCTTSLLGNTHCYSANGKYDNGTAVMDVVARGCIDCSDSKKACEKLEMMMKFTSYKLLSCNIVCCSEEKCNTMMPEPTTTAAFERESHLSPVPLFSAASMMIENVFPFVKLAFLIHILI